MLSSAFAVPMMGRVYDLWGPAKALSSMSILPIVPAIILAGIWLRDHGRGGYRITQLPSPIPVAPHRGDRTEELLQ